MGSRGPRPGTEGRKPRPTALKLIDGNPGKRPLPENEPMPTGAPICPKHLSGTAKTLWQRIKRSMPPGLYTLADSPLLAAYCEAWADHVGATKALQLDGSLVVYNDKGVAVINPLLRIRNNAASTMVSISARLGLSPADRAGLAGPVSTEKKTSKWAGLTAS